MIYQTSVFFSLNQCYPNLDLHVSTFGNVILIETAGGRLNKKDGLTRYGDSHVKDKTS